ncbi:uncharacterized protein LOC144568341 isoform X2 [Carex rostrata]
MDGFHGGALETFHVGPCGGSYEMGFLIGERFSSVVRSRVDKDLILQKQLLPFASTDEGKSLVEALERSNRERYPRYWDELVGTASGSGVPLLHLFGESCATMWAVLHCLYICRLHIGILKAFTLNSVPPLNNEVIAGGIGRNFVSRDLLEALGIDDALDRICKPNVSVGHSYNLIDIKSRSILNIETASSNRFSIHEVGKEPFFHANMYLHLKIDQVQDENSISRQNRAATLPADSKEKALSLLGDAENEKFPIFMTGPILHTLCTVLIDLDKEMVTIYKGNPKNGDVSDEIPIHY